MRLALKSDQGACGKFGWFVGGLGNTRLIFVPGFGDTLLDNL